jgi:hypothetical protein
MGVFMLSCSPKKLGLNQGSKKERKQTIYKNRNSKRAYNWL